jgi:hypothetical protein
MTNCSNSEFKRFHFQEIGWIISFPKVGNEGKKYLNYTVQFADLKKNRTSKIILAEIVDHAQFEANFPLTVGFFKDTIDEETDLKAAYLEIRIVRSLEDFWKFLNDLDI